MTLLMFVGLFMMLVVLIQRGRGGGLAGAFGGAGGSSAFGTKAGDVFTKITIVCALIWFCLAGFSGMALRAKESRFGGGANAETEKADDEGSTDDGGTAVPTQSATDDGDMSGTNDLTPSGDEVPGLPSTPTPGEIEAGGDAAPADGADAAVPGDAGDAAAGEEAAGDGQPEAEAAGDGQPEAEAAGGPEIPKESGAEKSGDDN